MDKRKIELLRMCGLDAEADKAEQGLCPTCGCERPQDTLLNELSKREFAISGMCQECQDATFAH